MDLLSIKNRLAAKILKAEIIGDQDRAALLKKNLERIEATGSKFNHESHYSKDVGNRSQSSRECTLKSEDDMSAKELLARERQFSSNDETKLYLKTSAKFAKDSEDTRQFSEEIDDSQIILKSKKQKVDQTQVQGSKKTDSGQREICDKCSERTPKHLILDKRSRVFLSLLPSRSIFRKSHVVIRNQRHDSVSFLNSDRETQNEVEQLVRNLKKMWNDQGYGCVILETFFKNFARGRGSQSISGIDHFQVFCVPIKIKDIEQARMYFKQALLESEKEWSMNKKLVNVIDKKVVECLPRSLSYFWVCFGDLTKGFAHVIEDEETFPKQFGFEVLAGLLGKSLSDVRHPRHESYEEQFDRAREFKYSWSENRTSKSETGHKS